VRRSAEHAMQSARHFYFARAGRSSDGAAVAGGPDRLGESLDRVRRHLVEMRARAEALGGRLDVIMKHEVTIRQIAQQVRLSGLNAVLICAKLGEEGRSLRELAQWLRALTDESDAIVQRLQGNLAVTRSRTEEAGQAGVDRLEQALSGFITDAETLNAAMARINATVTETARGFDAAGRQLPLQIGQAEARLAAFRAALGDLQGFSTMLGLLGAMLARPAEPFADETHGAATLARLRARYTMQQERSIHDATLAVLGQDLSFHGMDGAARVQAVVPSPPVAAAEASLDDIFF
jgi:methyl-accepting chemotaxis protein